jgi:hypothetical protein
MKLNLICGLVRVLMQVTRNNLFTEIGTGSFQRPLLVLFDRNFELAVTLQHQWTYQPLVHDVMGLNLNRITVQVDLPNITPDCGNVL